MSASRDVAYHWSVADDRIDWHGRAEGLFGDRAPPATGSGWMAAIFPDDLAYRDEQIARLGDDPAEYDIEYRIQAGNGQIVWVHDCGTVERGADGAARAYRGVLRNVTRDRKSTRLNSSHSQQSRMPSSA